MNNVPDSIAQTVQVCRFNRILFYLNFFLINIIDELILLIYLLFDKPDRNFRGRQTNLLLTHPEETNNVFEVEHLERSN